jgi:site-specific recombinase XerD
VLFVLPVTLDSFEVHYYFLEELFQALVALYKRGRIYWVRGSHNGARIKPRSLDTSDRVIAEKRKRQLEFALDVGENPSVKWKEFVRDFFAQANISEGTRIKYEYVVGRFVAFAEKGGLAHAGSVTQGTIERYVKHRRTDIHPSKGTPIGEATVRVDLLILHRFFRYAVRSKLLSENPVSLHGLEKSEGPATLPFEQWEIDTILRVASRKPGKFALLPFFLYTGMRISDVCGITREAVNLSTGRIVWKTKKRRKVVFLSIHPRLAEALRAHLAALNDAQRASGYLFPTLTGKGTMNSIIDRKIRRICRRAKVKDAHAHRFRDTFAVRALSGGATLYDVSKLLGITMGVAEQHYSPYVNEVQERGKRLVDGLDFVAPEFANCTTGVHSTPNT